MYWEELNGTEQFVAETAWEEIEKEGYTEEEMESCVVRWASEYGFANDEIGLDEEPDVGKVIRFIKERICG